MIFGFGKKRDDEPDSGELEIETVLFQGAINGVEVDLSQNARLAQVGLVPAKELVSDALSRRAEMFNLVPKANASSVTLYVDGVPYPGERLQKQEALAITQILKLLAGLDIKQRKRPQSGGIKTEYQERPYHLLIDSTPLKTGGEKLVVRARMLEGQPETPDDLGFSDDLRQKIRDHSSQPPRRHPGLRAAELRRDHAVVRRHSQHRRLSVFDLRAGRFRRAVDRSHYQPGSGGGRGLLPGAFTLHSLGGGRGNRRSGQRFGTVDDRL